MNLLVPRETEALSPVEGAELRDTIRTKLPLRGHPGVLFHRAMRKMAPQQHKGREGLLWG